MEKTYSKTQADLDEIADLMAKVFVRRSYFDFYRIRMNYQTRDPYYKPEHSRIIKEDGRIISHVSIIEKHMRIGQGLVKVAGIGDVCTHPAHQGKSYSRILMEDAIEYMRQNDFPLSMLYGIPNYYHKFGYIEAMGTYSAFLPVKFLTPFPIKHSLRPCEPADLTTLNNLYNTAYATKTGSMQRIEAHWYRILEPKEMTVSLNDSGKIAGYAIASPPQSPDYFIHEVVTLDLDAARSLLSHFAQKAHERYLSELEFRMAPDHPLMQYAELLGGRFITKVYHEGEGQAMLRIINLFRSLEGIKIELENRISASLLKDSSLAFNIKTDDAGEAGLDLKNGSLQISAKVNPKNITLSIPQNILTRSLIGYWSLDQLKMRAPDVAIPEELDPVLRVLFPNLCPVTCNADYF